MFSHINEALNNIFTHFDISSMTPYMVSLKAFTVIYLGLLITINGYRILAGKYDKPFKTFIYEMVLWSLITTIAFNTNGYWSAISDAIDGVHVWAGGGIDLYAVMDKLSTKTGHIADILSDEGGTVSGAITPLILWAGFLIASIGITFILIGTTFTLKLLILVAPLAVVALLFGWIKQAFTQWLVLLLSNTLTVLLIGIIVKSLSLELDSYITNLTIGVEQGNFDEWLASFNFFVFGLFVAFLSKTVLNLASGMAGGGIDSMATRATKGLAQNALNQTKSAGKASLATSQYVANKVADKFKK